MDTTLKELIETMRTAFPEKTIVDIADYENEEHQTYKYMYETQAKKINELTEENFHLQFKLQDSERETMLLKSELDVQKSVNKKLTNTTMDITEFIKNFSEQEILVSNIRVYDLNDEEINASEELKVSLIDSISDRPGVYGHKRPSWFTPLKIEFNKNNVAKRAADNTKGLLNNKLTFWKRMCNLIKRKEISLEEAQTRVDVRRKTQIIELLNSNGSNYEKFLKYFLLTPGLPKHYMNTLVGAAELGLDANVIIELLEQPKESFNREIIEIYVSETHKGTEFNLKKEFAYELLRGDWYVTADINGKTQKFQMAPIELLESINEKLTNISTILSEMADEQLCANLARSAELDVEAVSNSLTQSCSDFHEDEYETDLMDSPTEFSSFIDFDDSVLMNP